MEITQNKTGDTLTVAISGRLDTNTAPELQDALVSAIQGMKQVDLDLAGLDYISSAGLRVLLFLHKQCTGAGAGLSIFNCNEMAMDVFRMTGFDKILHIQ